MTDPLSHSIMPHPRACGRAPSRQRCNCDVAVIGGGFTGSQLRWLARRLSVILIEQQDAGHPVATAGS